MCFFSGKAAFLSLQSCFSVKHVERMTIDLPSVWYSIRTLSGSFLLFYMVAVLYGASVARYEDDVGTHGSQDLDPDEQLIHVAFSIYSNGLWALVMTLFTAVPTLHLLGFHSDTWKRVYLGLE